MDKINILILVDMLQGAGGAENQILELAKRLNKEKYRLIVSCLSSRNRLLNSVVFQGIETKSFLIKRIYDPFAIIQGFRFIKFLQKEKIDILMTYHFGSDVWGGVWGKLAGVPVIVSNRRDEGFWKKGVHIFTYKIINRWVDKIVVVSKGVKNVVINDEGINEEKIELIYNGVNLERFNLNVDLNRKRRELSLLYKDKIIGCVSNLRLVKGLEFLINAAETVIKKYPNTVFLIIGKEGGSGEKLFLQAKELGIENNIRFLGGRNDIPDLLSIMDICVLPSLSEGLSNTLLEYMAAGKPIVATNVGGNPELIQHNINGLLVKAANYKDLFEKIIFLLEHKDVMMQLGKKAKEDVESNFGINLMIRKYESFFNKLMEEKKPKPAIVLGMSANGLSVVRSLGRKGIPVIGLSSVQNEPGRYSRILKRFIKVPNPIYNEKEFISCLLDLGTELKQKVVLFATADEYISLISRYSRELSLYYHFLLPEKDLVESFLDKKKTCQLVNDFAVLHPASYFVDTESGLEQIINEIKYPCIIKPRKSHLWREKHSEKKVFVAHSKKELIDTFKALIKDHEEVFIQQVIPGADSNIYEFMTYFDCDSKPLAYFCCRKLRQYPPHFGIGCFSESVRNTKIIELGLEFLKKIRFKGLGHIEFKIDSYTGNPVLLEVNLRTSFIGELSVASGIDLPYIAYRNLAYGDININNDNFRENIKLLNLELDLGSFARSRKNNEINFLDWVRSFRTNKIAHSYFAMDDLRPFLMVYIRFFSMLFMKAINSLLRQKNKFKFGTKNTVESLRIAHLISSNGLFGAEKVMLSIASQINYNGMKSSVVAIQNTHNPHSEVVVAGRGLGLPAFNLKSKGRIDLGVVSRLTKYIKANNITLLHSHNYKANLIGLLAARRAKIPVVATVHGYIGNGRRLRVYEALDRFILRFFDKVILVDDSLKKWFKNGKVKCEVINNGVDTRSPGHQVTRSQVRVSLGIKEDELVIGTVGRLSKEKGHKYLLEAFAKLIKEFPKSRLMIVGDGELRKDLEDLSVSLGIKDKVIFTGFQDDVSKYYQNMDIYVSSSLIEHFPMVVLEAMSYGKTIVATNVGGTSDLVKDGVTGILINPSSSEEICNGIIRYMVDIDLRKNVGTNAQKFIEENYSLEKMMASYKNIYEEVLSL